MNDLGQEHATRTDKVVLSELFGSLFVLVIDIEPQKLFLFEVKTAEYIIEIQQFNLHLCVSPFDT